MAFSEIEAKRNEVVLRNFLEKSRPPAHLRDQVDIGFDINGHVVELVEIRPDWKDKTLINRRPFARIRYVKSQEWWRLYWMRGNLKWQPYEPSPDHRSLQKALSVVQADEYGCFFG